MQYDKGNPTQLTKNFNTTDFDCKCVYPDCKITLIDDDLLDGLEELWDMVGEFQINSGYRCEKHNKDVKGEKGSKHLIGIAADIESLKGLTGPEMSRYVLQIPAFEKGGLGVAEHWLHCDVRKIRGRWTYPIQH